MVSGFVSLSKIYSTHKLTQILPVHICAPQNTANAAQPRWLLLFSDLRPSPFHFYQRSYILSIVANSTLREVINESENPRTCKVI
jgi:hypothetical protein